MIVWSCQMQSSLDFKKLGDNYQVKLRNCDSRGEPRAQFWTVLCKWV
ncbi:hypothetical protein CpipJ_CPIJ005853 [Culex quinquefasciatus]|uniref:Uncharacterized protein n=1 Tax=Culex quinquefasciatus TaxID=7176 RepID=B0WG44_CULQU|nr:hypothetical protein CpipJ_CPIJ005853 [Culex quinquefasciatus]|eukprot:XP_001847678.1 hypothetical protein CpipJ_CPIJ005853 [Culex quinquefasciatus]